MAQPAEAEASTSGVRSSLDDTPKPSQNELLLSRRLLQVQQERDNLAAELARMKLEQRQQQQQQQQSKAKLIAAEEEGPLTIPPPLVPVLALLRSHITNLTRDNEALRYTFLGSTGVSNTTSPNPMRSPVSTIVTEGLQAERKTIGVDLEEVLKRVKTLVKENEELGEMVLEAGRNRKEVWEQALDQSTQLITSLDADLEHHLGVIQSLQAKLAAYEARFDQLSQKASENISSRTDGRPVDVAREGEGSVVTVQVPSDASAPGPGREIRNKERLVTEGLSRRGSRGGRDRGGSYGIRGRGRGGGGRGGGAGAGGGGS